MYDVLETVSNTPVLVEAEVTMYKTEDGGKTKPFTEKYRPNHNFDWPEVGRFFIGQIELQPGEWVHPGETRVLNVTFLDAVGLRELLSVGRVWKIHEGSKAVGEATVREVVHAS